MEKMDCRVTGEVILEVRKPRQPHWGCLRITKWGTLSSPFVQEQPIGGPLCCRQRLQTDTHRKAQKAAQRFVPRWKASNPRAVDGLQKDLSRQGGTNLEVNMELPPSVLRTPHVMERRFREVRGRSRPMGTFSHRTRMEIILYSVFTHENLKQGTATPFLLLTQKIILP
jgi:hypothetical protein